ncbi:MAG: dTDP-4-dehydrorhamnose reductase [Frankiales bacterium]|nr:dTDP-4-dehydrorhamnose reductase [Frankiales bacterium]
MTVLVTGASGQLGRALAPLLPDATFTDVTGGFTALDITSRAELAAFDWSRVTAVLNAAAWTAVDPAEDLDKLQKAWDVNVTGVANLAWHARRLDLPFLTVSTDYVLRGDHEGDAPIGTPLDPQGAYGITKAASEIAARIAPRHHVVRTSWVFGDGPNFVRTMRRLGAEREQLTVVDDQLGRPTYAVDLAEAMLPLLTSTDYGVHHATGSGPVVSWAGFARACLIGTACTVVPITTEAYGAASPRPANSALAPDLPMRDWREALAAYLASEGAAA